MSRRHADNWSHPSHYLVDPYTWPWSPNGHDHGHERPTATSFVQCQPALPFWDTTISKFDHENPWSRSSVWSKAKVTFDLQNSKVKVMVKFKPIGHIWGLEFNRYICFSFRGNRTIFWLRYTKFCIWPWKFKVKVMAKVKPDGHIWALEFNRCVCFSFRGNRITKVTFDLENSKVKVMVKFKPIGLIWGLEFNRYVCFSFRGNLAIFGWDIANSIFDLENSRSRSWPKSNPMVTFEP